MSVSLFLTLLRYNTSLGNLWSLVFAIHVSFLLPKLTSLPVLFQSYLYMYQYQFTNWESPSGFSSNICNSDVEQAYDPYSTIRFLHILMDLYSPPGELNLLAFFFFFSRICFFQPTLTHIYLLFLDLHTYLHTDY